MSNLRTSWWWIGGLLSLLMVLTVGCDDDNSTSPVPEPLYDLSAELIWDAAVNMDLWVIEPTGKGSGHGDPGETAVNTGNNDCGFGTACDLNACTDLPCNTPEQIVIPRGFALPETTEPFHTYELGISNWSTHTTTMMLTIQTQSDEQTLQCTVDGPRVSYVATIAFPSGAITPVQSFIDAFCEVQ